MSIIKINAIAAPEGAGEKLERHFSANLPKATDMPGFIDFQLLHPAAGESRCLIFTEQGSEEVYQGQREDHAFKTSREGEKCRPMSSSAELLEFDVMLSVKA